MHTPGPWVVVSRGYRELQIIDALDDYVAAIPESRYIDERSDPESEANARLISAAPNLLAALRAAHTRFGQMWPGRSPGDDETWALVDAAIKRAEGV